VRHDRRVGADSAIRFMTDGVLMRQLQSDFLLRSYSVILLDEAHERSLNTDLLLGELQYSIVQLVLVPRSLQHGCVQILVILDEGCAVLLSTDLLLCQPCYSLGACA
jgi:hypothetical protein